VTADRDQRVQQLLDREDITALVTAYARHMDLNDPDGVAALFADGETTIRDVACVDTSFPGFARLLAEVAPACGLVEVTDDV
jgi:hypothetical protein